MVISLIATSKFFGAGEKRPEKGVFTHFTFGTPISLASASAKSTSKPLGSSIGSSTNPATGNSAPTVRVPGCLSSSAPPCPEAPEPPDDPPLPPPPLPPLSSPPHPAIVSAATTTATAHTSFLTPPSLGTSRSVNSLIDASVIVAPGSSVNAHAPHLPAAPSGAPTRARPAASGPARGD